MNLASDVLFYLGSFPITNTILTTIVVDLIIVAIVFAFRRGLSLYPKTFQNIIETVYEYFYDSTKDVAGTRAAFIYPWVLTFFIFIVIANFMGLLPGFESIRFFPAGSSSHEGVALFKTATSDLNLTASYALISILMCQIYSIKYTGIKAYIGRFVSLKLFGLFMFVGLLEFVGEFTKIISLSFRLFGNITAGEVLLSTMSSHELFRFGSSFLADVAYVFTITLVRTPFMLLEILVAAIQAIVFAMLTMAFMNIMTEKH